MITQDFLREKFIYADGFLKKKSSGKIFGCCRPDGYRRGFINYKRYYVHRLIWIFHYGNELPEFIDHIDGDPRNNHIENLRAATKQQNNANQKKTRGSSKYKGVWWSKKDRRWIANIKINQRKIHLGSFCDEKDAARAYNIAAHRHFGDFALLNEVI